MNKKVTGILLMVLAAVGLASSTIVIKFIYRDTGLLPSDVSIWRFVIASAFLWLLALVRPAGAKAARGVLVKPLLLGVVFGLSSLSAMFSLNYLPSSLYILILYIYPSLVVVYALLAGKSVPKLFWLGLPLTFIGLFLTAFDFQSVFSVNPVGFVITMINALAMSAYLILSERVFSDGGSKAVGTRWMLTGAMLFNFLWIPLLGLRLPDTGRGWVLSLALGIFGTRLPLLSINVGLQLIGAARGSMLITLQPVIAVLFSTIFLDETLTLQQWVGGGLVIASVILLQLSADREARDGGNSPA